MNNFIVTWKSAEESSTWFTESADFARLSVYTFLAAGVDRLEPDEMGLLADSIAEDDFDSACRLWKEKTGEEFSIVSL